MGFGDILACVAPNSFPSLNLFPPTSKFDPQRDMLDLTGKIMIVTGGNAGIGYQTVSHLLRKNAKVYLAARSAEKAEAAIAQLQAETGATAIFLRLDLSDLKTVRSAAEEFLTKEATLDVLFNNAGIMGTPIEQLSAQGYDAQWQTNVLGPYLLTKLLIPALRACFTRTGVKPRVINLSSALLTGAPKNLMGIDWKLLKGGIDRDTAIKSNKYDSMTLYGQSKLANITLSLMLIKQHGEVLSSPAVHPGVLKSALDKDLPAVQAFIVRAFVSAPIEMGPLTQLFAATAPLDLVDGKFLIPWARVGTLPAQAENVAAQDALYDWLETETAAY